MPSKKYRLKIEDESRLETLGEWSLSRRRIAAGAALLLLASVALSVLIVMLTPLKSLVPGYYRSSDRASTEEMLLRLDSIRSSYERNQAYMTNLLGVIHPENRRLQADSVNMAGEMADLPVDSLMEASPMEARFVSKMREREKYNVSVLASLASEGMLFYPVCETGTVTPDSRDALKARVILPSSEGIMAVADCSIVAVYGSPLEGDYSVVMLHPNGFMTRYSGLGSMLAGQGDVVVGGQVIALSRPASAHSPSLMEIEMWHNGSPVTPYKYIGEAAAAAK